MSDSRHGLLQCLDYFCDVRCHLPGRAMVLLRPLWSWLLSAGFAPGFWCQTIAVCSFAVRFPPCCLGLLVCGIRFRSVACGRSHVVGCPAMPSVQHLDAPPLPFVPFWGRSFRYGEALHPDPSDARHIRVAVCNPTAVRGKEHDLLQLKADLICLSETSAVSSVQRTVARRMQQHGFRSFFGQPVPPHAGEAAEGFSVRGAAGGVAIMSSLPARRSPEPFPEAMHVTTRVTECFVRFGPLELRVLALYGVPATHLDSKHANNALLKTALSRVTGASVPTLIAGDLNMDVTSLPVWPSYLALGYAEAHTYVSAGLGVDLPPTCKGSTRWDTMLLPRLLQPYLRDAQVLQEHIFDSHDPLVLTFLCPDSLPALRRWTMPKPWTDFAVDPLTFAKAYDCLSGPVEQAIHALGESQDRQATGQAFSLWASHLQAAVDCTLAVSHALDPVRQPQPGLPRSHRGRCQPLRHVARPCPQLARAGRHGDFTPAVEGTSVRLRMRVRQVGRCSVVCVSWSPSLRLRTHKCSKSFMSGMRC